MDRTGSVVVGGVGAMTLAWVAKERNRILGQELTEEEEKLSGDLVIDARERELSA